MNFMSLISFLRYIKKFQTLNYLILPFNTKLIYYVKKHFQSTHQWYLLSHQNRKLRNGSIKNINSHNYKIHKNFNFICLLIHLNLKNNSLNKYLIFGVITKSEENDNFKSTSMNSIIINFKFMDSLMLTICCNILTNLWQVISKSSVRLQTFKEYFNIIAAIRNSYVFMCLIKP